MRIQSWEVYPAVQGDAEQVNLWVQVRTGLELDEYGSVHALEAAAWRERKKKLDDLGNPVSSWP